MDHRCVFVVSFDCREGPGTAALELTLPFPPFVGLNVAGLFEGRYDLVARVASVRWNPATGSFSVAYEAPVGGMDALGRMMRFADVRRLFIGRGWDWVRTPGEAKAPA
jgi:hypothetical protein